MSEELKKVMAGRQVCPIRLLSEKYPECTRDGCAWWTKDGTCAVRAIAEKK